MDLTYVPYLVSISSLPIESVAGGTMYGNSLDNVLSDYEQISILYAPVHYRLGIKSKYARYYKVGEAYPGNLLRFEPLHELFISGELNRNRWVIFTDTFDVKFQASFPDFRDFEDNEILVADEGEKWGESSWFPVLQEKIKKVNFIKDLSDKNILNAGTWAMKGDVFIKMYQYMELRSERYDNHPWSDQPMYNEFVYGGDYKVTNHPNFVTVLHGNLELGNTIKEGNYFRNRSGELYSIVHGNGSTKEYLYDK